MASISESAEHRKIHETKELLCQDARSEFNSGFENTTSRVSNLIGVSGDKNEIIDTAGLQIRILTNTLTRAERLKIRQMAGVSK